MDKNRLYIIFFIITGQVISIYGQSDLIGVKPFLIQTTNSSSEFTKRFCADSDSISASSDEKWVNNQPINISFDWEPFKKTMGLIYNKGKISQLLVENIYDTTGLNELCSQIKPANCYLFRGYCDSYPINNDQFYKYKESNWVKVTNWIILFQFNEENKQSTYMNKYVIWDSTAFYVEVLQNPVFKYEYGFACYSEGEPPLGRYAMYYLRKQNKMNLINNIAECKNDEGLMFIVEYYKRLNLPLPNGFDQAMTRKIAYCDGCTDAGSMTIGKMITELSDTNSFGNYIKYGY